MQARDGAGPTTIPEGPSNMLITELHCRSATYMIELVDAISTHRCLTLWQLQRSRNLSDNRAGEDIHLPLP